MIKSTKTILALLSALLVLALAGACSPAATPQAPTPVPPTPTAVLPPTAVPPTTAPAAVVSATTAPISAASTTSGAEVTGASLFQLSCAECHGQDRAGITFTSDGQTISVPELTWDELSKMYSENPSRGDVPQQLTLTITKGQDEEGDDLNSMMPRWSSLSDAQVASLIQYLQTASGASSELSAAAANLEGEQLYQAACAACHGEDGAGKTFDVDGNKISTPSLQWSDLSKMYSENPDRGDVAQQLSLAITKGQDEEGEDMDPMMPHWSFLSQAQVDSLVQYIQTTFK